MFIIPKVIGLRGAASYAPENTLSSIHAAADMGIEWVHIDVKLTKDGTAIIFQDEDLLRCTGSAGLVAETSWDAIREMDAGSWYGDSFIGEKIPTLEQALEAIQNRGLGANIDINPCPGREVETAEVILDIATRLWDEETPPPLISSLSHVTLETALEMIDAWPRGMKTDDPIENWQELAEYLAIFSLHFNASKTDRDIVEEYMESQKTLLAYTVNDPEHARELVRWGVDGFLSETPDVVREAVETKH